MYESQSIVSWSTYMTLCMYMHTLKTLICAIYYVLIAIVERDTRKYHQFIAGYCLRVRSTSKQYLRQ